MKQKRWRFGDGQSGREERDEMRAAQAAGRSEAYVAGQEYRRLIEAERQRRAARRALRRDVRRQAGH